MTTPTVTRVELGLAKPPRLDSDAAQAALDSGEICWLHVDVGRQRVVFQLRRTAAGYHDTITGRDIAGGADALRDYVAEIVAAESGADKAAAKTAVDGWHM